jgi:hypothetical protein
MDGYICGRFTNEAKVIYCIGVNGFVQFRMEYFLKV